MESPVRCPYCVEGNNFKLMMSRHEGRWFVCEKCSHMTIPTDPDYACNCPKCTAQRLTSGD
jgi:Zn finger protein HypA/HybF involved in hydrogenase expression